MSLKVIIIVFYYFHKMPGGAVPSAAGKGWFDECSIDRDTKAGDGSYKYDVAKMCLVISRVLMDSAI